MTGTSLSVLLAFSFALQDVDVGDSADPPPPVPSLEDAAPALETPAAPDDDGAAADESANEDEKDDRAAAPSDDDDKEESGANYGAAIGSAVAWAPATAIVGALFGACGLCFLASSQSSDDCNESLGAACALMIGCPASLAVGIVPPVAALAGGCLGALAGDGNIWGAVGGAAPGVLIGVGGFALIVTGLALGLQTEGQGRDALAPWPLAPGSPPTAPDSLAYTAGVVIAVLAGPIAVAGAALGGMMPNEEEDGDDDGGTRKTVERSGQELRLAEISPAADGTVAW